MDKRKIFNLNYDVDVMNVSVDMAYSLSDELDHAANHYRKELEAGHDINVEEMVRKLNFFNNMFHLQINNLNDHMKNVKAALKELRE